MSKRPAPKKVDKTIKKTASARSYEVIQRPVITEKTTVASEQDKIVFRVTSDATKKEVKEAVETIFGVKVKKVNTLNTMGKTKVFKGKYGKRSDHKKAVVTLEKGQKIDIASGAA